MAVVFEHRDVVFPAQFAQVPDGAVAHVTAAVVLKGDFLVCRVLARVEVEELGRIGPEVFDKFFDRHAGRELWYKYVGWHRALSLLLWVLVI